MLQGISASLSTQERQYPPLGPYDVAITEGDCVYNAHGKEKLFSDEEILEVGNC